MWRALPVSIVRIALTIALTLLAIEASAAPRLELMGVVWSKPILKVLVRREAPLNYVAAAARAFKLWRAAINYFTRLYGYEYLRKLRFEVYVEGFNASPDGYDVVVSFLDVPSASMELGETTLTVVGNRVVKAEVKLFLRDYTGAELKPIDILNVALHEVGHVLCLGHASRAHTANGPELMYYKYTPVNIVVMPSTLDVYGVALVFQRLLGGRAVRPLQRAIELPARIPYRLTAYYYVHVVSTVNGVEGGGWYLENETALVRAEKTIVRGDIRYVFEGWSGDVEMEAPQLSLRVTRNYTLIARWIKQYRVIIENLYPGPSSSEIWVNEGDEVVIALRDTRVEHGNGTLRVFRGWTGSVEASSPGLRLKVWRPLRLKALWDKYYRVKIAFTSADGLTLSPQPTLLMLDGRLMNESALWLKPGEHVLEWALWRGIKVRALANPAVKGPGTLKIPLAIWRPLVRVTDILGLPVPFVEVKLVGPIKAEVTVGLDAYGRTPELPEGIYEATIALGKLILGHTTLVIRGDEVLTLHVLINPYVLVLVLMLAVLVALALRRESS